MDLIVSSGSVFSEAFGLLLVISLSFASLSGSEDELRIFNFEGSGGNNGTIRKSLMRRFQRWLICNLVKFGPLL